MAQRSPHGGGWVWDGREWIRLQRPSFGRRLALFLFTLAGWGLAFAILLFGVLHVHPHIPGRGAAVVASDALPAGAKALPKLGSPSSPTIRSVTIGPDGACFVGGRCGVEVNVAFPLTSNPTDFAWIYKIFDPCTGGLTDGPADRATADAGWNHLVVARTLNLPRAKSALWIVAVTTGPQPVASSPYATGTLRCQ